MVPQSTLSMLHTTDAIVLALQPQSDKAHLLHAYTRAGGRINYKVYGLGRHHSAGTYAPFSLIQITGDGPATPDGGRLPSVRSSQLTYIPSSIPSDPHKQAIALFLSEVLFRTLRLPMMDDSMFDFIADSIPLLDTTDQPQNFHLAFLVELAARLGFAIDENEHPELLLTPATRAARQQLLRQLCDYFAEHIDTWQQPKSLDILMEIFD